MSLEDCKAVEGAVFQKVSTAKSNANIDKKDLYLRG